MKEKNQLHIGIALSYINLIIGNIVPIFYTHIMLRLLGQAEYGLFSLSSSIISYLTLINFGLGTALTRYIIKYRTAGDKEGVRRMMGLFFTLYSCLAVLVLILGTILSFSFDIFYENSLSSTELSKMRILLIIMTLSTALSFVFTTFSSVIYSHERFIFSKSLDIVCTILTPCINLVVLYFGHGSIGMAITTVATSTIIYLVQMFYCIKKLKMVPIFKNLPFNMIKELVVFSFFIFLNQIINLLYTSTDKAIIGAALGTTLVAVYNIGVTFNDILISISSTLSSMLTPRINTIVFAGATEKELTNYVVKVGRIQFFIISLIVSGFITFGQPFISLWAGEGYELSYYIALIIMIPSSVPLFQNPALSICVAMNRHQFRSIVYLITAVLNVVGTIFFVDKFGIIGASFTTCAANVIGPIILMNWFYHKKLGINMLRFWKNIFPISILPLGMIILGKLATTFIDFYNLPILLIGIAVYAGLYFLLLWFFAFNKYEKDLGLSILRKVKLAK